MQCGRRIGGVLQGAVTSWFCLKPKPITSPAALGHVAVSLIHVHSHVCDAFEDTQALVRLSDD